MRGIITALCNIFLYCLANAVKYIIFAPLYVCVYVCPSACEYFKYKGKAKAYHTTKSFKYEFYLNWRLCVVTQTQLQKSLKQFTIQKIKYLLMCF